MKNHKLYLPLAALALLVGCKTTGPYAPEAEKRPGLDERTATIALMDEAVKTSVTSAGDRGTILLDGRLRAEANLKNRESRPIVVQVQCVFKDEQGFDTEGDAKWVTLPLAENATETVTFDSMNTKARKYTILVKQAR